jgi:N-acetylneuraminic acid mutarotase
MTRNSMYRSLSCTGALVAVALSFAPRVSRAQAPGKWMDVAPFPDPREEVMGEAANGKMYVFAGLIPLWHPAGLVYEYDPATNQWTKKKPMALPSHHVAFCEHDGKIYAFGGFVYPETGPAAWVPINNTWEYDPAKDSWKAMAPMPTKRGAAEAAEVDGKIYVIGGATTAPGAKENYINQQTRQNVLGTVEEFDPKANTWRARTSMPTPRNHMGIGAVDGKIYVIGGRVGAAFIGIASDISLVEVYNPATDMWETPRARMPTARSAVASAVYNGKILIAGGEWQDPVVQTAFRVFEAYDPATNTWTTLPPMATPRHGVASAVIGNRFYAVSGDVQSSGTGVAVSTPAATAFEFSK